MEKCHLFDFYSKLMYDSFEIFKVTIYMPFDPKNTKSVFSAYILLFSAYILQFLWEKNKQHFSMFYRWKCLHRIHSFHCIQNSAETIFIGG